MLVQVGAPAHSFNNPTGLMSDCHRRIETFLGALQAVGKIIDRPLADDVRHSLDLALRYFREAAPKHTADEEESLFPRLQQCANAEAQAVTEKMSGLEADHRRADRLHQVVDRLGRECLQNGQLSEDKTVAFRAAVAELAAIYGAHIELEDKVVFPLAARVLTPAEKAEIGREMAARRKIPALVTL